jgi:hypothetical protein
MAGEEKKAWVERVLGFKFAAKAADAPAPLDPTAALKKWSAARSKVVSDLVTLGKAIAKSNDPERAEAIILLQAIGKNLTAEPKSLQSVNELERYLTSDTIVEDAERPNGYRVKIAIRRPLLAALAALRSALPAQ